MNLLRELAQFRYLVLRKLDLRGTKVLLEVLENRTNNNWICQRDRGREGT